MFWCRNKLKKNILFQILYWILKPPVFFPFDFTIFFKELQVFDWESKYKIDKKNLSFHKKPLSTYLHLLEKKMVVNKQKHNLKRKWWFRIGCWHLLNINFNMVLLISGKKHSYLLCKFLICSKYVYVFSSFKTFKKV